MDNERIIELFEEKIVTMHNLSNLKYQLKERWDDAKQNTLIHLMEYNQRNPIEESTFAGLAFITLKQQSIMELNNHKQSKYYDEFQSKLTNFDDIKQIEAVSDTESEDSTHHIQYYREKLLELITMEEYVLLVQSFSTHYELRKTKEENARLNAIKRKLGYKSYFEITVNGEKYTSKSIRQFIKKMGWNEAVIYDKRANYGKSFKYLNNDISIRKKTVFTKIK